MLKLVSSSSCPISPSDSMSFFFIASLPSFMALCIFFAYGSRLSMMIKQSCGGFIC